MSLKEAREKWAQLKAMLKEGKNLIQVQNEKKEEQNKMLQKRQIQEEGVFERVTKEWIRRQLFRWTEKHC